MSSGLRRWCSVDSPLPKPPSRRARQLALAYKIERMIEAGELRDYADAARRLGVSRARMTHVMDLMLRPVWEQEEILTGAQDRVDVARNWEDSFDSTSEQQHDLKHDLRRKHGRPFGCTVRA